MVLLYPLWSHPTKHLKMLSCVCRLLYVCIHVKVIVLSVHLSRDGKGKNKLIIIIIFILFFKLLDNWGPNNVVHNPEITWCLSGFKIQVTSFCFPNSTLSAQKLGQIPHSSSAWHLGRFPVKHMEAEPQGSKWTVRMVAVLCVGWMWNGIGAGVTALPETAPRTSMVLGWHSFSLFTTTFVLLSCRSVLPNSCVYTKVQGEQGLKAAAGRIYLICKMLFWGCRKQLLGLSRGFLVVLVQAFGVFFLLFFSPLTAVDMIIFLCCLSLAFPGRVGWMHSRCCFLPQLLSFAQNLQRWSSWMLRAVCGSHGLGKNVYHNFLNVAILAFHQNTTNVNFQCRSFKNEWGSYACRKPALRLKSQTSELNPVFKVKQVCKISFASPSKSQTYPFFNISLTRWVPPVLLPSYQPVHEKPTLSCL